MAGPPLRARGPIFKSKYGENDTRCNLYDLEKHVQDPAKTAKIRRLARSVGCLISKADFKDDGLTIKETFVDSSRGTLKKNVINAIKKDQKFKDKKTETVEINFENEPCLGRGTGFLIGKDLVLSAAHTIFETDDHNIKIKNGVPTHIIFDFVCEAPAPQPQAQKSDGSGQDQDPEKPPTHGYGFKLKAEDVYKISCVVAHQFNSHLEEGHDWVVLRLDRPVQGRDPLKINFEAKILKPNEEKVQKVWMLGFPMGIPLKWSGDGEVTNLHKNFFQTNVTSFVGNSGSPFFCEESDEVVGILCSGNDDYDVIEINNKWTIVEKINTVCIDKEYAFKIQSLDFLKTTLTSLDSQDFIAGGRTYQSGLSLEGYCSNKVDKNCNDVILKHFGFTKNIGFRYPDGSIDVAEACSKAKDDAKCQRQGCGGKLLFKDINTLILAKCRYKIEAINTAGQKIIGEFTLQQIAVNGNYFRFDIQKWKFLHLTVDEIR